MGRNSIHSRIVLVLNLETLRVFWDQRRAGNIRNGGGDEIGVIDTAWIYMVSSDIASCAGDGWGCLLTERRKAGGHSERVGRSEASAGTKKKQGQNDIRFT